MPNYTLVPALERASIDDYVDLFNKSFGGDDKLNARYLDWQYLRNPDGRVIGFDAFLGDELAAHYATIPRRYGVAGSDHKAALSVNTATHPAHQGKGLFTKLADATYREAAARGVQFIVGVANGQSVGAFTRKLGFTELGRVRLYAGFKAVRAEQEALDLRVTADWLAWRLANPSRRYERVRHADGSTSLSTSLKGIPFRFARIDTQVLQESRVEAAIPAASGIVPGLSPYFAASNSVGLRLPLPLKMQPSPWHVIWRSLDAGCDATLASRLRLDGLAMDTF